MIQISLMQRRYLILFLLGLGGLWLLSGCAPLTEQAQMQINPQIQVTVTTEQCVGQTFVARHDGLESISLWLAGETPDGAALTLYLRTATQATEDLRRAELVIAPGEVSGWYRFNFAPLADSQNQYYYAVLESPTPLQVGAGVGDSYLDGALYQNHQPGEDQMAFQLAYAPGYMAIELGRAALVNGGWLGVAFWLYVIPGWAIWVWLWRGRALHWAETLCVAIGLSLALYPLFFLWTHVIGLHLGAAYAWLPPIIGSLALLWRYKDWRPQQLQSRFRKWWKTEQCWADVTLMFIAGLCLVVRLYVIQGLEIPMWGDSYQHTMMTQLLIDHNGLFSSWAPYAPFPTFTYHFGLHALVAVFHWITQMAPPQALLWVTQWLNFCAVLILYLLAARISTTPWSKVGSVLLAGLLTSMPMFYINWGRYTQLAGQVLLPVAVWLTWELWETQNWSPRHFVLGWLLAGGLALTHYRVLIFFIVFVVVVAGRALWERTWRRDWGRLLVLGIGGGGLALPWLINTLNSKLLAIAQSHLARSPAQATVVNTIGELSTYLTPFLWLLLAVATATGLWQRKKSVLIFSLWWFGLLLLAFPNWLQLPGSGIIGGFTVFIAAYIPAGLLIPAWIEGWGEGRFLRKWRVLVLCTVLIGLGMWGVPQRLKDVQRAPHALVTRPDLIAMQWIKENTPGNANFLVNGFFAYNDKAVVGSDGGWWMPLLGQRANVIPPLSYTLENEPWQGYRAGIRDLFAFIQANGIDSAATLALLHEHGITHIYIGQRQGRVNYVGPDVLNLESLLHSAYYRLLYHQDRVWIFEVAQ